MYQNKLLALLLVLSLGGCVSEKYQDVQLPSLQPGTGGAVQGGVRSKENAILFFEPVVGDKRFDETVWDNVSGPLWSPDESKKIGFTQHYKVPVGGGVGGPASAGYVAAKGGKAFVDSRIMLPMGRLIADAVEIRAKENFDKVIVCFNRGCVEEAARVERIPVISVSIEMLTIAETKLNHLTLVAKGTEKIRAGSGKEIALPLELGIQNRSLEGEGRTHKAFIKVMNNIGNEFSYKLADQIVAQSRL